MTTISTACLIRAFHATDAEMAEAVRDGKAQKASVLATLTEISRQIEKIDPQTAEKMHPVLCLKASSSRFPL